VRQNRPSIKVRPVDDNADVDTAIIFDGLIRHIEQQSFADIAYETANFYQTVAGHGYFRIIDGYAPDDPDDRELFIKPIHNVFSVYFDENSVCPVGSDARSVFITEEMSREEFERQYPDADAVSWDEASRGDDLAIWFTKDSVRIAEWFELKTVEASRVTVDGEEEEIGEADYWDRYQESDDRPSIKSQRMERSTVCIWRKITGNQKLKETELPISYIPVIRVPGEIVLVDGKFIFKGIVRDARDSVRMVSYWFSTYTEAVALQPKAPFVAAAGTLDGFEDQWNSANVENYPVLQYNPVDINGQPATAPQRQAAPMASNGIMQGLMLAKDAVKSTTGQFDASLGKQSNETSGVAIRARASESDTATYHLIDNMSKAIRHAGRILIQWIPKVYEGKRVARIIGEDGEAKYANLDSSRQTAMEKTVNPANGKISRIYNLGVGCYDVISTVGPSFSTKRQEGVQAMTEILRMNPALFNLVGDIFIKSQDWPGADEMSKRIKLLLPPQVQQGDEDEDSAAPQIPPQVQQQLQMMQQQLQEGAQIVQQLHAENEQLKQQSALKAQELQVKSQESVAKVEAEKIKGATSIHVAEIEAMNDEQVATLRAENMQLKAQLEMASQQPQQVAPDHIAAVIHLANAIHKPRRKRMMIQAPSGAMFSGEVLDEPGFADEAAPEINEGAQENG
jgi:hypothetical protein